MDLKAVESSLENASKSIETQLAAEIDYANFVAQQRKELERQLHEMQNAEIARSKSTADDISNANRRILAQLQRDLDRSGSSIVSHTSLSETELTGGEKGKEKENIGGDSVAVGYSTPTKKGMQPHSAVTSSVAIGNINNNSNIKSDHSNNINTTISAKPTSAKKKQERVVTNQHPPADLFYTKGDVGRVIQMYAFRYSAWENVELVDFEPSNNLHKCKQIDGSEKWFDLRKKPIRGMPEEK